MDFPQIWPLLRASTRSWLMEHNGEPLSEDLVAEIRNVAGGEPSTRWWTGSSVEGESQLSDEAVDWIETVANDDAENRGKFQASTYPASDGGPRHRGSSRSTRRGASARRYRSPISGPSRPGGSVRTQNHGGVLQCASDGRRSGVNPAAVEH